MTTNIYVLQLEGGKWYVGKSNNIVARLQEHLSGTGSAWTKKYRPISVAKTLENVTAFEEDKVTKEYMAKYGIDRVRGGTYVAEVLDSGQVDSLNKEIWAATDCCTNCGRKGHFVKDCVAKTDVHGSAIDCVWECGVCRREFSRENDCLAHERVCRPIYVNPFKGVAKTATKAAAKAAGGSCYRCGRAGHYANTCYARTYAKGRYYSDSDSDYDSGWDSD